TSPQYFDNQYHIFIADRTLGCNHYYLGSTTCLFRPPLKTGHFRVRPSRSATWNTLLTPPSPRQTTPHLRNKKNNFPLKHTFYSIWLSSRNRCAQEHDEGR